MRYINAICGFGPRQLFCIAPKVMSALYRAHNNLLLVGMICMAYSYIRIGVFLTHVIITEGVSQGGERKLCLCVYCLCLAHWASDKSINQSNR